MYVEPFLKSMQIENTMMVVVRNERYESTTFVRVFHKTIFEKHKKNKKYKLFDPSNYSSSEFVDMSTITSKKLRKWFSLVPNVHDDDSIYRPFLKKVR